MKDSLKRTVPKELIDLIMADTVSLCTESNISPELSEAE